MLRFSSDLVVPVVSLFVFSFLLMIFFLLAHCIVIKSARTHLHLPTLPLFCIFHLTWSQHQVQETFGQWSEAHSVILGAVLCRSWTWQSLWVSSKSGYSVTLFLFYSFYFNMGRFHLSIWVHLAETLVYSQDLIPSKLCAYFWNTVCWLKRVWICKHSFWNTVSFSCPY